MVLKSSYVFCKMKGEENMQIYTYKECLPYLNQNKVMEEGETYQVRNQKHDKIFKEILDNKREGVKLLNKYLDLKIEEKDIEKYTRKFVLPELENRESDVIYKLKNEQIFFLIEHQTKVDYSMPFRMLEYIVEIMRSAVSREKMQNKSEKLPIVVPIVIYTGKENWNVPRLLQERQAYYGKTNLEFKYNLVDGSKISKEELMKENSILSKAILLEKLDNPEEILEILKDVTTKDLDSDEKYFINLILKYLFPEKLSKDETKEILENLKGKEDDTMFIDILRKYFDDKEKEAVRTAVEETAKDTTKATTYKLIKEMLRKNIDEKTVIEVTKISKQELKEIKAAM